MIVYQDEDWRGQHSRYTFTVHFDSKKYTVIAKVYRKRKDDALDCVYHKSWECEHKDDLKLLDYDGLRLPKRFIQSDFFE